jgi:preprotein translocase subunit SecG
MITFLYVVYVMVCLFLILVVLLQAGRGGMGAAFGGSSATVFGGSGAGNFLTKLTVVVAALFMTLSATLTYVSSSGEKSLENASERVRLREEARSGKDAKDKAKKPAAKEGAAAPQSTPEGAAAPAETAPVETAPTENAAPEGAADQDKDAPEQK